MTTCVEMLEDRGCVQVQRCSVSQLCDVILAGEEPVVQGWKADGSRVVIYIHSEERIGVKFARSTIEREHGNREDEKVCELALISCEGPTPFTRKECEGKGVQFLSAKHMCQNVTRHTLVPRHERIDKCPEGYRREHLPKLLESDAVVQYYNWSPGTVVRIERHFGGNEPIVYFRLVSAANI